jgi:hypothetical protein
MGTVLTEQHGSFQVVVVGGGLAGLCAAIAAARAGAKTALVHNRSVLGGNASSEIRVPPAGAGYHTPFAMETGIVYELILADRARNHDRVSTGMANSLSDLTLYEAARAEENLTLLLDTHIEDVDVNRGRILAVSGTQLGTETHWRLTADLFIDATGDGAVGAGAGCEFRVGQEAKSEYGESFAPDEPWSHTLGNSLHFRARDIGAPAPFTPPPWAMRYEECLPYRPHTHFEGGYWWIELGWPYDSIRDNDRLRDELLGHVLGVWDHIKNHCPDTMEQARNWAIDWIGMVPGRRGSRRFVGTHVLTQPEIDKGGTFPDAIGFGGWEIDDHTREGIRDLSKRPSFDAVNHWSFFVRPYGVPLRSLQAKEIDNLLFAGRCMSASRLAFNSLRVMLTLGALGQAAGTGAALCAKQGVSPVDLTEKQIQGLQQHLLREDVFIPGVGNRDTADLARTATVTASSSAPFDSTPAKDGLGMPAPLAQLIPVGSGGLVKAHVFLASRAGETREVTARLVPAGHVWDLPAIEASESIAECHIQIAAGTVDWCELDWSGQEIPAGFYWLRLDSQADVVWRYTTETIPGCPAVRFANERWWFTPGPFVLWRMFAVRVSPDPEAYGAEQVLTGVTRPGASTNLWRSNPADGLPATLDLAFGGEREVASVQLVFDTDLSRTNRMMGPFFHAPECARDYEIQGWLDGRWQKLCAVTGNLQRRRIHHWAPVRTERLRLVVQATHGVPEARLYEIRVYGTEHAQ